MIKQHIFMQNLTHRLTVTRRTTHAEEDGEAWNELRCELWLAFPCTDLWGPHLTMSSAEWRINKGIQKRHTHTHTHTRHTYTCQVKHRRGSSQTRMNANNTITGWADSWPTDHQTDTDVKAEKAIMLQSFQKSLQLFRFIKWYPVMAGLKVVAMFFIINPFLRGLLAF